MTRLTHLRRGVQIMLAASILLLADTFLDWQRIEFSLGRLGSGSVEVNAWDDFLGAMMGLLTIVLLLWIFARIAGFTAPVAVSEATVDVLLAGLVFAFALIKNLTNDYSTWASYVGVALALVILGGALLGLRSGGVEEPASAANSSVGAESASGVPSSASPVAGPAAEAETEIETTDAASHTPGGPPPDASA